MAELELMLTQWRSYGWLFSKACKICPLVTLNIYIKGERNKINFIYFKIIMNVTYEDKFCVGVSKTKLMLH